MRIVIGTPPPRSFKVMAILALIWMLFGVLAWVMDLMTDPTQSTQLSAAQRELYASRPQWLFIVYALAIFSGLAGAIGLLMRKRWATTLFVISLIAVIVQFGYTFIAMHAVRLLGVAAAVSFPAVIFAIAVFWVWYSSRAGKRGWLGD